MKFTHTEKWIQDASKQRKNAQATSTKIQITDVAHVRYTHCTKRDWNACRVTNITHATRLFAPDLHQIKL